MLNIIELYALWTYGYKEIDSVCLDFPLFYISQRLKPYGFKPGTFPTKY